MEDKIYNVLFLCTGNSSRSIMAEALLNTMGKGRFRGYSAGSHPTGAVNPFALEQIRGTGYALTQMRSKSWDEFSQSDAPHMDFVFTVCDNAAGEVCPVWPGHPISAHWGFEDPAAATGTDEQRRAAFNKVYRQILTRMNLFTSLPLNMLEKNAIQAQVSGIGSTPV
ncbi:arsenate reductase ArsC [Massilia timonae]|uniref:arsenate reductase ArsC n=1 Tax=Massilia timonae TaxID=47229 RepID=UPI0028D34727|nr:arsenate reductase ArsC [Massilia timonae]